MISFFISAVHLDHQILGFINLNRRLCWFFIFGKYLDHQGVWTLLA